MANDLAARRSTGNATKSTTPPRSISTTIATMVGYPASQVLAMTANEIVHVAAIYDRRCIPILALADVASIRNLSGERRQPFPLRRTLEIPPSPPSLNDPGKHLRTASSTLDSRVAKRRCSELKAN
jgi:hypothetical protein